MKRAKRRARNSDAEPERDTNHAIAHGPGEGQPAASSSPGLPLEAGRGAWLWADFLVAAVLALLAGWWLLRGRPRRPQRATQATQTDPPVEERVCEARRIHWAADGERRFPSERHCRAPGAVDTVLLEDDVFRGSPWASLCPRHAAEYLRNRVPVRCCEGHCYREGGLHRPSGGRYCWEHWPRGSSEGRGSASTAERPRPTEIVVCPKGVAYHRPGCPQVQKREVRRYRPCRDCLGREGTADPQPSGGRNDDASRDTNHACMPSHTSSTAGR